MGKLNGGCPYTTSGGMNQHTFAHLQACLRKESIVSSHKDLWHTGRLHKIQVVGNFNQQAFMSQDVLSLPSTTCQAHHSLPRLPRAYQRPNIVNHARKFKSRNV